MHGTVHSKSDDGEANTMKEDKSLCEKDTQVLECVKKYTQDIDIPVHALLSTIVEPVVDMPKSSKRHAVSEKYDKWKHGTLKNAYNPEGKSSASHDRCKGRASPKTEVACWAGRKNYATHQVNPPLESTMQWQQASVKQANHDNFTIPFIIIHYIKRGIPIIQLY